MLVIGDQRQHVGNGRNINVWEDPWLLLKENPFISSLIINGLEHSKVEDLFNLDEITWIWQGIGGLFNERD